MSDTICWLIGSLITISIYLMLSTQLMRWLFGIVILSSTINLVILLAGRLSSTVPAFIPIGQSKPDQLVANPLPQALILTAIVIGFGLLAFSLILVRRVWRTFNTTNSDQIHYAEFQYLNVMEEEK
jgi:multicomponent Na+:H+ antiporter subunit C